MAGNRKPSEQEILHSVRQLYPVAALYLGGEARAKEALTEAAAAAIRKKQTIFPEQLRAELIRICRTRVQDRQTDSDLPEPLLPLLKLPAGSRRDLAFSLCGVPAEEAADACGHTAEEQQRNIEKAFRQFTFSQGGHAPDQDELTAALGTLKWTAADAEHLMNAVTKAEEEPQPASNVHEIVRTKNEPQNRVKSVSVPVWGIVLAVLCLAGMCVGVIVLAATRKPPAAAVLPQTDEAEKPQSAVHYQTNYLSLEAVQKKAAEALSVSDPVFLSTKLKTDEDPPVYSVSVFGGGKETDLEMDAVSGKILQTTEYESELTLDMTGWQPAEDLRKTVLKYLHADAEQILFLKEKCSSDGDLGCCKYELTDTSGRIYNVQIEAETGALMKYSVEEPQDSAVPENILPPETIMQHALTRAGDLRQDQVIFTKLKSADGVYLVAFTLDDGTQYLMELDAQTGMANTVDVSPVSADTTHAAGLLAARDQALQMAGLTLTPDVRFTKAKIDRSSGAYVYELEFETDKYDYEVTLNTESCEVLKFRASQIN